MNDRLKRIILASMGVVCVGVAAIGAVLPGVPTLGPLLFGSLLLAKSSPALERRLVRNRLFAKYLPYLDGKREMSAGAKWAAAGMMWLSISISSLVLYSLGTVPRWVIPLLPLAGLVGSWFIYRHGAGAGRDDASTGRSLPLEDDGVR